MKINKKDLLLDLKAILINFLIVFVSILYFELLLYFNIHNSLNRFTIYNVLFLIPISFVFTSILGFNSKIDNVLTIFILFIISIFYIANLIYFKTFGSLFSISMIGAGKDAVTNFWWSVGETIKENILIVILFELPIILFIVKIFVFKNISCSYKLILKPFVLIIGIALWFLVVLSLGLSGKKDYTPYGAYHSRYVDTDTASSKLGILPNTIVEIRYSIFGSNRQELIEVKEVEQVKTEPKKQEKFVGHVYDNCQS